MKQKSLLLTFLWLFFIGTASAQLPFKTTTIVDGQFAANTTWYTMQIGSAQHLISDNGTADRISLQKTLTDLSATELWCFVGDATTGYQIYNKNAGPDKVLASSASMVAMNGYGGTGGSTYPTMQPVGDLPEGYIAAWDIQPSDKLANTEGFFFVLHGTDYALNNFGGIGTLAFWAEGKDANSTITIAFAETTTEINGSNGTFTSSNAAGNWHGTWSSTELPGFTFSTVQNNMILEDGHIVVYSGLSGSCTHRLTAPEGCVVHALNFDVANQGGSSDYALTFSVYGNTYPTSATKQNITVADINERIASYTQSGANKGVVLTDYKVTIRRSLIVPEPHFEVFPTPTTGAIPYRIPGIAKAYNGDLIAVADYRHSRADIGMATNGRIDIHARISKDNGATWGDIFPIIEGQGGAAASTNSMYVAFGDPCIVADSESPRVMVLTCSGNVSFPNGQRNNHQGIARFYSEDNGQTWGKPVDISEDIYKQFDVRTDGGIRCMFIGSGKISQSKTVKVGDYYRLYCAPLVKLANGSNVNFVLYSDNFGETWSVLGGVENSPIPSGGDEPKADELPDGSVLISSRTSGGRIYNIYTFTDTEKGEGSWGAAKWSNNSNHGVVAESNSTNGEILFVPVVRHADQKPLYLALQSVPFGGGRANVGIYYKELETLADFVSPDSIAKDWDGRHQSSYLSSAYSTMCWQADNTLAFVYEEDTHGTSGGGYTIVYKNYSIEQITDSAYSYSPDVVAHDIVKAGIHTRKIQSVDNLVGGYSADAVAVVDEAIAAYEAQPSLSTYEAINKACLNAPRLAVEPGQIYRIRNYDRKNASLYLTPEASRYTAATSNLNNANQIFTFVPAATAGEYYLHNPNYGTYLGKLTAQETQPAVVAQTADAGTWTISSDANGISQLINVNRTCSLDGLHLAGDNQRLVPWHSTSAASWWYIELVNEVPVTIPKSGLTTLHVPFAFQLVDGMKAYVAVETTVIDDVECLYIEPFEPSDRVVPANTPVILQADAGSYNLLFAKESTENPSAVAEGWKGTLCAQSVKGALVLKDDAFSKNTTTNVPANKAYYLNNGTATKLTLTETKGVPVGIEQVTTQASVRLYDLNGRRVVRPASGLYITSEGKKVYVK